MGKQHYYLSRPVFGSTAGAADEFRAATFHSLSFFFSVSFKHTHTHSPDENKNVYHRHAPGLSNAKRDGENLLSDIEMGSCVSCSLENFFSLNL